MTKTIPTPIKLFFGAWWIKIRIGGKKQHATQKASIKLIKRRVKPVGATAIQKM